MEIEFRQAKKDDGAKIAALINSSYRGESSQAGWTTECHLLGGLRTNEAAVLEIMERPFSNFILAFGLNSELLGCVHLERISDQNCYLGMLTVKPTSQSSGIGRLLLQKADLFAQQIFQSKVIEMTVITARDELIKWYERRGYKRTGKMVPFPVHPEFGVLKVPFLEMEILSKELI